MPTLFSQLVDGDFFTFEPDAAVWYAKTGFIFAANVWRRPGDSRWHVETDPRTVRPEMTVYRVDKPA